MLCTYGFPSVNNVVANLQRPYDLIFVDIDKEPYPIVLLHCVRLLGQPGLLVTDNTLFHGTVPRGDDTSTARALREYNSNSKPTKGWWEQEDVSVADH